MQGGSRFTTLEIEDDGMDLGRVQEETTNHETQESHHHPQRNRAENLNVQTRKKQTLKEKEENISIASPRDQRPKGVTERDPEVRRKMPKQVAAETEHTVVTSTNKGLTIDRYTIRGDTNTTLLQGIPKLDYHEHHNDPPTSKSMDENERMDDDTIFRRSNAFESDDQGEVQATH